MCVRVSCRTVPDVPAPSLRHICQCRTMLSSPPRLIIFRHRRTSLAAPPRPYRRLSPSALRPRQHASSTYWELVLQLSLSPPAIRSSTKALPVSQFGFRKINTLTFPRVTPSHSLCLILPYYSLPRTSIRSSGLLLICAKIRPSLASTGFSAVVSSCRLQRTRPFSALVLPAARPLKRQSHPIASRRPFAATTMGAQKDATSETPFLEATVIRRSTVALKKESPISDDKIISLIQHAIKYTPSPFNVQASRAVILLGDKHDQFWDITHGAAEKAAPAEFFKSKLEPSLKGYKAGYGTVSQSPSSTTNKSGKQVVVVAMRTSSKRQEPMH